MLICHNCGTPIENKARQCHHCHSLISADTAFRLPDTTLFQPLKIAIETQPNVLNRLINKELIEATSKRTEHHTPQTTIIEKPAVNENYFLALPAEQKDFFAQIPEVIQDISKDENSSPTAPPLPADFSLDGQNLFPAAKPNNGGENKPSSPADWFLPETSTTNGQAQPQTQPNIDNTAAQESLPTATDSPPNPFNLEETSTVANENIHRRSFSGTTASPSSITNQSKTNNNQKNNQIAEKAKDPSAIFTELKSRFFSGIATTNNDNNKTAKNKAFGLKAALPLLLAGIVIVFLLFKGFEAFCTIGGNLFGNALSNQAISISGRWQFASKWNNAGCRGQMVLHQNGAQIFGQGMDQGYGSYKFNGQRTGNHLDLLKQYYVGNNFVGHPIELHGDLDPSSKPLFLNGNFSLEYMQGGKWRGKPVSMTGIWEAELIQPMVEDNTNNAYVPQIQKRDESAANSLGGLSHSLSKNGSWFAGLIIAAGCFLYYGARALISPDGLLGIWDKQKYVPAQFMKEHKKEKAQLAKPIVAGSLPLGQRWEWKPWQKFFFWIPRYLAIPPELRVNSPHVLILGGGEKGKSRLMAKMITHDIESADRAIVVVDSDGDLADLLLRWMSSRANGADLAKRTIVIDPTNNDIPSPSFNPLELPDDHDLQNAASSIVNGFKAIYHEPPGSQNQWSPQTAHILRNCAMLLMANGKTLLDLPTLLQDNDFRDILLEKIEQKRKEKVEYSTLLETWGQYKRLARTEQWINWYEPILNRVGPTLINQRLRPILTQPKGDINLKNIIAEKKILIVKIPKGQLHEDANLLGSLIVTGMKQAAISLCSENKVSDRTAVMYLDEFDHFIEKETLDAITTETKKFQLGFIGATKTLQHLPEDWRNQIEANIGTMCVFALTKKDGDMLGPRMFRVSGRKAKHRTLMNIFNPINTSPQFELISDEEKYNIDRVLAQSERQFYAFRVGAEAGIFRMRCLDFDDIPDNQVDVSLLEVMYKNR